MTSEYIKILIIETQEIITYLEGLISEEKTPIKINELKNKRNHYKKKLTYLKKKLNKLKNTRKKNKI